PRRDRDASPHLHLRGGRRLRLLEPGLYRRRLRDRARHPPFHGERLAEPAGGRARARRPVGRAHAGVADGVAAAATRLRHDPSRLLPRHLLAGEIWSPEGVLPHPPLAPPSSPP